MRAYTRNAAGAQAALVRQAKSEAPWLAEYLRELTLFPAGRRDDQVDSTAQALAWIKRRPRAHGMAEHWRRMAEEGAGRRVGAVRLIR